MIDRHPPEREFTLAQARQRISEQLRALSLKARSRCLGREIVSVQTTLRSASDHRLSTGCGKGTREEAEVGALFEALEHYLTDHHPLADLYLRGSSALQATPQLARDGCQPWLQAQPKAQLACRRYHPLQGDRPFEAPVVLSSVGYARQPLPDDTFDYRGLRRYASSSGTAIGASRSEAILHGLNECIERDALSLFLLTHFHQPQSRPLRQVVKPIVHDSLGYLWRKTEHLLHQPVTVYEISNEFTSRTFLATTVGHQVHGLAIGVGTSLTPRHAVRRALTELAQVRLNQANEAAQADLLARQRHLLPYRRLHRCILLDFQALEANARVPVHLAPEGAIPGLGQQLALLDQSLRLHGFHPGYCELFQGQAGVSLVNVLVPGLERFYLVTSGNVVIPGPRGRRLCSRQGEPA